MDFAITVITSDHRSFEYLNLDGPVDDAKAAAIALFHETNTGSIEEVLALPMLDYMESHLCYDPTGHGCCEHCGGVIYGTPLDRALHGDD